MANEINDWVRRQRQLVMAVDGALHRASFQWGLGQHAQARDTIGAALELIAELDHETDVFQRKVESRGN